MKRLSDQYKSKLLREKVPARTQTYQLLSQESSHGVLGVVFEDCLGISLFFFSYFNSLSITAEHCLLSLMYLEQSLFF